MPSWQSTLLVRRACNQSCLRRWCLLGTERILPESTEKSEKNEQGRGNLTWLKERQQVGKGKPGRLSDGLSWGRVRTRGSERGWLSCVQLFATPWTYTVHGILRARILEWVAIPFSRGSSQPRDRTQVSCTAGRFFTSWATSKSKDTGVGSHSLLQGIFQAQGWNPGLPHCRRILYQLSQRGSPRERGTRPVTIDRIPQREVHTNKIRT